MHKTAVVVGAGGDVGHGIARALLAGGWRLVTIGRRQPEQSDQDAIFLQGDVSTPEGAAKVASEAVGRAGQPDLVIASINTGLPPLPMSSMDGAAYLRMFSANLVPHVEAARAFLPVLKPNGTYLAIGGGMADYVVPGMAGMSAVQAAQRMIFRHLAADPPRDDVRILELMLQSMIAGHSNAGRADPRWLTAAEVGRHVMAILADPAAFPGPILRLATRKMVGVPDQAG